MMTRRPFRSGLIVLINQVRPSTLRICLVAPHNHSEKAAYRLATYERKADVASLFCLRSVSDSFTRQSI